MTIPIHVQTDKKPVKMNLKKLKRKLLKYPYKLKVVDQQLFHVDMAWVWKLKSGNKRALLIMYRNAQNKKVGKFFTVSNAKIWKKYGEQESTKSFLFNFVSTLKVKKAIRRAVRLWCIGKWSAKNFDYEVIL